MTYTGTDFTGASPGEDEPYELDFKRDILATESIQSAEFYLWREPDKLSFNSHLTRGVIVNGTKVSQYVTDLPRGPLGNPTRYRLTCLVEAVVDETGETRKVSLHSYIPCS